MFHIFWCKNLQGNAKHARQFLLENTIVFYNFSKFRRKRVSLQIFLITFACFDIG